MGYRKGAFIGVDDTVALNGERVRSAREWVEETACHLLGRLELDKLERLKEDLFYSIGGLYRPEKLNTDTVVPGAQAIVYQIQQAYDTFTYVTSKPDYLYEETVTWLQHNSLWFENAHLICKPEAFCDTHISTPTYKAGTICMLADLFDLDEILFIDREEANRAAVQQYISHLKPKLLCSSRLDGAWEDVFA